jgi:hypothetical protein
VVRAVASAEKIWVEESPIAWRELATRQSGSISVQLLWRPQGNEIHVRVNDEMTGEEFVLAPPRQSALAAFLPPVRPQEQRR